MRSLIAIPAFGVALGCGTQTATSLDAGPATEAGPDAAAYRACHDDQGNILPSLKACATSADCVARTIVSCCAPAHVAISVSRASAAAFDACEANAPACVPSACVQFPWDEAEDGRRVPDGGAASLACSGADGGSPVCHAYVP
jgi:hypothetical protein